MDKEERLKNYILYVNENLRNYDNQRKIYFELNIGLMSVFGVVIPFIFNYFNDTGKFYLMLGLLFLLGSTFFNIIVNLLVFGIKTKGIVKTNWHYKENITKITDELTIIQDEQELIQDDTNQLKNLFIYQLRYYKYAKCSRIITLIGALLINIFISVAFFSGFIWGL